MFRTYISPSVATPAIEQILRNHKLPYNIHEKTLCIDDGLKGYKIIAESTGGKFHNTRVTVNIKKDPVEDGSIIRVMPHENTTPKEAIEIEKKLREAYARIYPNKGYFSKG